MPRRSHLMPLVWILVLGIPVLGIVLPQLFPPGWEWRQIPLHSGLETIGAMIAIGVGGLIAFTWRGETAERASHAFTAAGLIGMGVLDAVHAMVPAGNAFVWLHSAASLLGGLFFAANWLPFTCNLRCARRLILLALGLALGVGLLVVPGVHLRFPLMVDGAFTTTARIINVSAGLLFFSATLFFIHRFRREGRGEDLIFAIHTALFGTAGVAFELSTLWDAAWWWWHLLRLTAYIAAFVYMVEVLLQIDGQRRRSERALRGLVEAAPEAVIAIDAEGLIEVFNPAAEEIFGRSAEEMLGRNVSLLMPEPHRSRHHHYLKRHLEGGGGRTLGRPRELLALGADGRLFPIRLLINDWSDGKERRFVAFIEDLSEEKAREELLLQAHGDLEMISRSLSHDVRTPLRAIDGFSHVLLDGYGEVLDETGRHYLQRIRAASQRMGELIDAAQRISYYSHCEMERRRVDLAVLAGELLEHLASQDPGGEWEVSGALFVEGDRRMLREALYQLLDNAWKFSALRGERRRVEVSVREEEGSQLFFVGDNGIGIEPRYRKKVFEAFQRLHGDEAFPGHGVGLTIAERIIARHGGEIWLEEGLGGEGVEVCFRLGSLDRLEEQGDRRNC